MFSLGDRIPLCSVSVKKSVNKDLMDRISKLPSVENDDFENARVGTFKDKHFCVYFGEDKEEGCEFNKKHTLADMFFCLF